MLRQNASPRLRDIRSRCGTVQPHASRRHGWPISQVMLMRTLRAFFRVYLQRSWRHSSRLPIGRKAMACRHTIRPPSGCAWRRMTTPFWQSFGKIARVASPFDAYPSLRKTYADDKGALQLRRFFDLLAVHELAHAFEDQGGTAFPTLWLSEVYANLALYAFVAKRRPSELANLMTLPEAQTRISAFNVMMRLGGYTSLDEFQQHYPMGTAKPMSGPNYGWYQVRFHVLARDIFNEGGEAALARLWAFGQKERARRGSTPYDYFREHGTIGWFEKIRSRDLASRLATDVSPRLGRAVAGWD
jgi:hypothetical protein